MAHTIESRANIPANQLRDALDKAERMVVSVDQETVEDLLVLFDQIEFMFAQLAATPIDLRPEQTRWTSLQNRIYSKPNPIVRAAAKSGGMSALRTKHPPAEGDWWRLDSLVLQRRRKSFIRLAVTLVAIVGGAAILYWSINTLFPPNPAAVLMVETTASLDPLIRDQRWEDALALVQNSQEQLPQEPELWIWNAVLNERLGHADAATQASAEAQRLLSNNLTQFWVVLGTTRLRVGDLAGAEEAATRATAENPDDPQAYFLLGNVAEGRGDTMTAMDMYNKTYELAEESNPELAVIARVRLGQMLQQPLLPHEAATMTAAAPAVATAVAAPAATPTP